MIRKVRSKDLGFLFVVGGPGGSGSSTIARMLAEHFSLRRVYGGGIFQDILKKQGYADREDAFFKSNEKLLKEIDSQIDNFLKAESQKPNVLIESKNFAILSCKEDIPTTVKIWITANLHARVMRSLYKVGIYSFWNNIPLYIKNRFNLIKRFNVDRERYNKMYGIKYECPKEYNDIVIDSSNLNEEETFNLILKYIKDGGYIK